MNFELMFADNRTEDAIIQADLMEEMEEVMAEIHALEEQDQENQGAA